MASNTLVWRDLRHAAGCYFMLIPWTFQRDLKNTFYIQYTNCIVFPLFNFLYDNLSGVSPVFWPLDYGKPWTNMFIIFVRSFSSSNILILFFSHVLFQNVLLLLFSLIWYYYSSNLNFFTIFLFFINWKLICYTINK